MRMPMPVTKWKASNSARMKLHRQDIPPPLRHSRAPSLIYPCMLASTVDQIVQILHDQIVEAFQSNKCLEFEMKSRMHGLDRLRSLARARNAWKQQQPAPCPPWPSLARLAIDGRIHGHR